MRTCEHCKKDHYDPYIKFCKTCYFGVKREGTSYKKKIFKKDLIGSECDICKKIRIKESDIENKLCRYCYQQERIRKNPQIHERHKKLCRDYRRKQVGIDTELPLLNAPAGSGYIGPNGYKKICKSEFRKHPNADRKGRIFEHTYIMSMHLGRPLKKGEQVHHINGIRHDNRLENLELWHRSQPSGQRLDQKIEWCKKFLEEYGYIISESID